MVTQFLLKSGPGSVFFAPDTARTRENSKLAATNNKESPFSQESSKLEISAEGLQKSSSSKLTEAEEKEVKELKERDSEVRQHEQAHLAAAGQHAKGGIHYEFQNGPDNKSYAIGGHVNIDTSKVPNDPKATLEKAQQIKRSALAPAEPSGQDRKVAGEAQKMEAEARNKIREDSETIMQAPQQKHSHPALAAYQKHSDTFKSFQA
jgi:hypothetical protein